MEKIIAYRWRGVIYETHQEALKAVDAAIGVILCNHARNLIHINKYSAVLDYIESCADDFAEVARLKADKELCHDDELLAELRQ